MIFSHCCRQRQTDLVQLYTSFSIHWYFDSFSHQIIRLTWTRLLRFLVGFDDLGHSIFCQSCFKSIHTPLFTHRVAYAPTLEFANLGVEPLFEISVSFSNKECSISWLPILPKRRHIKSEFYKENFVGTYVRFLILLGFDQR